jgi:hypothetical protein
MDYLENKIDKLQELLLEIARNIRSGQINGDTDHDEFYIKFSVQLNMH